MAEQVKDTVVEEKSLINWGIKNKPELEAIGTKLGEIYQIGQKIADSFPVGNISILEVKNQKSFVEEEIHKALFKFKLPPGVIEKWIGFLLPLIMDLIGKRPSM